MVRKHDSTLQDVDIHNSVSSKACNMFKGAENIQVNNNWVYKTMNILVISSFRMLIGQNIKGTLNEDDKYLSTEKQEEVIWTSFNLFAPHPAYNMVILTNSHLHIAASV